jgi:orotidine-5'-phosphate decarboxylase
MGFGERVQQAIESGKAPLVVGLDPHADRLPVPILNRMVTPHAALASWASRVIDAVAPTVVGVKPQVAFFEQYGPVGVQALADTCRYARERGLIVLLDAKRGDIGSTAEAYARATLDDDGPMGADAVTLSPYLGAESLAPFVSRVANGKGLFLLVRTSNPGAERWQTGIAEQVADWIREQNAVFGGDPGPIGAVVGATLRGAPWRDRMPGAWFLAPGIGAQGAHPDDVVGHRRTDGGGVLATSSRGILYGDAPREGNGWEAKVEERAKRLAAALVP